MAIPTIERSIDELYDFLEGMSIPLDYDSPPAKTEDAPRGLYNVGQIVRQYIHRWLGTAPNIATPANLLELLYTLDELTLQIEAQMEASAPTSAGVRAASLGVMATALPGLGAGLWMAFDKAERDSQRSLDAVRVDLRRWRNRLDAYIDHVEKAPDPTDRRYTLWEVTNPLFLGWYGGPTGTEIELPSSSFPATFDPAVQHIADLSTPFQIANELGVWLEWDARKKRLLVQDIKDEAEKVADAVTDTATSGLTYLIAGLAVGGIGGAMLGKKLS